LNFQRAVWLIFFLIGAAAVVAAVGAFDRWAVTMAAPGAEAYCRGTFVGTIPLARAPMCVAVWFVEAKSWLFYARDMVLQARPGASGLVLLRTMDVGLFAIGGIGLATALSWLWASAMTQLTLTTIAAWYLLLQGLAHMLGRRTA
jgi:hypothetical protein